MMSRESVLPNFLIVGMAKCGTSSLSKYLQQHPDVFISEQKEPRFLSSQVMRFPMNGPKDDLVESWYVKDFESYKKLFQHATQKIIGEASADTLYFHQGTIPIIKQYLGNPKIIIIIRNPVKRAMSAYTHLLRDKREFLSFEEALMREQERIRDNYELIYHYKEASKYYEPILAFMQAFEHVKVILNEDLQRKPEQTLNEIFDFLGAEIQSSIDTSVKHNQSGLPKNKILQEFFQEGNMVRKAVRPIARTIFPTKEKRIRVFNWITGKNLKEMTMKPETKALLINEFKEDVHKTSALINKDLSFYLK
jgi:hypothetical protein